MKSNSKTSNGKLSPEAMSAHANDAAALLKALSHPARLLVMCQLVEGETAAGDLQPLTGLSLSALSQHLAVLRTLGLVETRRDAQTIFYTIAPGPAVSVLNALYSEFCAQKKGAR